MVLAVSILRYGDSRYHIVWYRRHTTKEILMTILDAVEKFFAETRLARRSQQVYKLAIMKFINYLQAQEEIDPTTAEVTFLTVDHFVDFVLSLLPSGPTSPEQESKLRTVHAHVSALRKFASFLVDSGEHLEFSTEQMRSRIRTLLPRVGEKELEVRKEDVEKFREYVRNIPVNERPGKNLRRLKIQALISFLYDTGVRVSEVCSLQKRHFELEDRRVIIHYSKGRRREVYFTSETEQALQAYWSARGDNMKRRRDHSPAFSGRDRVGEVGEAISPRTVEHLITTLRNDAQVPSPITPHSFRHALGIRLASRSISPKKAQRALGHASPQTFQRYMQLPHDEDLRAVFDPSPPPKKP